MYSFTKREQIVILIIVFIIVSLLGYKFVIYDMINKKENLQLIKTDPIIEQAEDEQVEMSKTIFIHISGQVYNPGLIELPRGSRINDAVKLAGGLKKDSDIDKINLALILQDEDKVYIPKIGEENNIDDINSGVSNDSQTNKIDINNCTKEELCSLPGIGEVTAQKIIDYRSQIKFKKIEDIMEVSGIGDKKFEAIKDLIVVK